MTISVGDTLPEANLLKIGETGPETVSLTALTEGKTAVVFGLPGAYTSTCTSAHVPSFIRTKEAFAAKGVDTIICVSVNDPFVMQSWSKDTGAEAAGLHMLADADGAWTKSIGLDFDAPPVGFFGRSQRYSMLVENGAVKVLNLEEGPGQCEISAGETLVEQV